MSGEQEPWVFRGGLTADLQVIITLHAIYFLTLHFFIIFRD